MSFARTRTVKASRKQRVCDHCRQPIGVGEPYKYISWVEEGEFGDCHVHIECHEFVFAYTCTDEGFAFLVDMDPGDEWELAENLRANPPPYELIKRLPHAWRAAVDEILGKGPGRPVPVHGSGP